MNDFAELRAALAAYHAAEYPSDRDVALARLGAAATPEVVGRLLRERDVFADGMFRIADIVGVDTKGVLDRALVRAQLRKAAQ